MAWGLYKIRMLVCKFCGTAVRFMDDELNGTPCIHMIASNYQCTYEDNE